MPRHEVTISSSSLQQQQPVTSLSLLRTMYDMCRTATASMGLRDLLSVSVHTAQNSLFCTKMVKKSWQISLQTPILFFRSRACQTTWCTSWRSSPATR